MKMQDETDRALLIESGVCLDVLLDLALAWNRQAGGYMASDVSCLIFKIRTLLPEIERRKNELKASVVEIDGR